MYRINKFQILDFNVSFSDHCPLLIEIQSLYFHQVPECHRETSIDCKWDDSRKAALLFWFFVDFRCGTLLFMVTHVIYKCKNR